MKAKWSLLTLSVLLLSVFSFRYALIPDPEDMAKKMMESIKKNDKQGYINAFSITMPDLEWVYNRMKNDPYIRPETKERWEQESIDTTEINEMNARLDYGYDKVQSWIQENNINTAELEYIAFYYELEYERKGQVYVIEEGELYVKYHDKYYCIQIDDAVYLNNRWVMGKIEYISERDQYLGRTYSDVDYATVDTTAYAMDSTAVAPEAYEEYVVDTAYTEYHTEGDYTAPELTKKQQKIQKKINKLEQKTYKLYDEMGVGAY